MKTCKTCNKTKSLNEFLFRKTINWRCAICKQCEYKMNENFRHSIQGLISTTYLAQKRSSKRRGHYFPNYTKQEFTDWYKSQPNLNQLMLEWKKSCFNRNYTPSVDRLNDSEGYTFDNIQLITSWQNTKIQINPNRLQVFQYDKELNFIQSFLSISHANKSKGLNNIHSYLNYKTHSKFIFSYIKLH